MDTFYFTAVTETAEADKAMDSETLAAEGVPMLLSDFLLARGHVELLGTKRGDKQSLRAREAARQVSNVSYTVSLAWEIILAGGKPGVTNLARRQGHSRTQLDKDVTKARRWYGDRDPTRSTEAYLRELVAELQRAVYWQGQFLAVPQPRFDPDRAFSHQMCLVVRPTVPLPNDDPNAWYWGGGVRPGRSMGRMGASRVVERADPSPAEVESCLRAMETRDREAGDR